VTESRGRLAFVPPRYGTEIVGGSEAVMREAAHGLARRGWDVEVLTTCARDHYTWRNEYEPGATTQADGVVVRRFTVVGSKPRRSRARIEARIQSGARIPLTDQLAWLDGLFRVPDLFRHLVVNSDRYDAVILSPYLFWTTVTGATIVPDRTIVMPCLHDEPYARLEILNPVLSDVARLWFLSEPEHELAHELAQLAHGVNTLPDHVVTGAGVHVPESYDPEGFNARHGLTRPFVLFAGRREAGKGWDWLLAAFHFAIRQYDIPFDLVTIGVSPADTPADLSGRVHDLGFLEEADVADAFAAASAYVQPSTNESFSRTIMESWLAGTPVLAAAGSEVLRWHCDRSGGGLTFADEFELAQCLSFLAAAPDAAAQLARAGREYVLANYRWDVVLDAMEASLRELQCAFS
jgi:glycosyltransferase involved in cell wall biosynthesis